MAIHFYSTAPGTPADYNRYLSSQLVKTDREGDATTLAFTLVPADQNFVRLRRGNYIKVTTDKYGTWYTGYIINDPEPSWVGHSGANKIWGYEYTASSDEYILNLRPVGFVSPFTNTTQGAILKKLVDVLAPGVFDVSGIQDGLSVARYVVDPKKKFSEILKDFLDSATHRFYALDHKLYFTESTTAAAGFTIDGNGKHFTPSVLKLTPSTDPIVNDALVIGDSEPQGVMVDYFVGSGIDGEFRLTASPYGVDQSLLLQDDFSSKDSAKWTYNDTPSNYFSVVNNALNVTGGSGTGLGVNVQSVDAFPLEGYLHITHGEYDFLPMGQSGIVNGVVCGMWTAAPSISGSSFPGCLFGIQVTRTASACLLTGIVNGALTADTIATDVTKRYILRTRIGSFAPQRYAQTYSYKDAYGNVNKYTPLLNYSGDGTFNVQTWITEVDPSTGDVSNSWIWFSNVTGISTSVVYATYVPVASNDLHCSVNSPLIYVPMQVSLSHMAAGSSAWVSKVIGANDLDALDGSAPDATITDSGGGATTKNSSLGSASMNAGESKLTYFKNSSTYETTIPDKGTLVKLTYRRAGSSMGRVRDAASIAAEAALWGDTGVRIKIATDCDPQPRSSAECEAAAAALVQSNNYQHYDGSYTVWSDYCTCEPASGAILRFTNLDSKLPAIVSEVINQVKTTLVSRSERFQHEVSFGAPDRVRKLLAKFAKQANTPDVTDTVEMPYYVDIGSVGTSFTDEVLSPSLVAYDMTSYYYDAGQEPPTGGGFEVRYTDENWGSNTAGNLAGMSASRLFSLPRTAKSKCIFIKAYDANGLRSRFAAGVGVYFPAVPVAPSTTVTWDYKDTQNPVLTVPLPAVQKDVWGFEATDLSYNVLAHTDLADEPSWVDAVTYTRKNNTSRTISCLGVYYNLLGEYGPYTRFDFTIPEPSVSAITVTDSTHIASWKTAQGSPIGYHVIVRNGLSSSSELPAPTLTVQTGAGSLSAGKDVWVKISLVNDKGETKPGAVSKIVNTAANAAILVTPPAVPDWMLTVAAGSQPTKYHVYVGITNTGGSEPTTYLRQDCPVGQMQYPRYGQAVFNAHGSDSAYYISGYKNYSEAWASGMAAGQKIGWHGNDFVFGFWDTDTGFDIYFPVGSTYSMTNWGAASSDGTFSWAYYGSHDHYIRKNYRPPSAPLDISYYTGVALTSTFTILRSPALTVDNAVTSDLIYPLTEDKSGIERLYGAGTVFDTKLQQFTMSDPDFCAALMYIYVTPYDAAGDGITASATHVYTPAGVVSFDNTNNVESIAPVEVAADGTVDLTTYDTGSYFPYRDEFVDESVKTYMKNALQRFALSD
jgi:hypothetical protein